MNEAKGGLAPSEVIEVAVNPAGLPASSIIVITDTPEACSRKLARSASVESVITSKAFIAHFLFGVLLRVQVGVLTFTITRKAKSEEIMGVAVNLRSVDLRGKSFDSISANHLVPRAAVDITKAVEQIIPLLEDVRLNGQDAVVKVTLERDGVDPRPIKVSQEELDRALAELSPTLRKAIEDRKSVV